MTDERRSASTNNVTDLEIAGWLAEPAEPGGLASAAGSRPAVGDDGTVEYEATSTGAAAGDGGIWPLTRGNAWELARWLAERAPGDVGPVELVDEYGLSPEFVQRLQSGKLGQGTRVPPVPPAVTVPSPSPSHVRERLAVVLALGVNAAVWTFALAWALGKVA